MCAGRVHLFAVPWSVAHKALLSMDFSRQEYWSGQLLPSPGDLPSPGAELESLASTLKGRFFTSVPSEKPLCNNIKLATNTLVISGGKLQ